MNSALLCTLVFALWATFPAHAEITTGSGASAAPSRSAQVTKDPNIASIDKCIADVLAKRKSSTKELFGCRKKGMIKLSNAEFIEHLKTAVKIPNRTHVAANIGSDYSHQTYSDGGTLNCEKYQCDHITSNGWVYRFDANKLLCIFHQSEGGCVTRF